MTQQVSALTSDLQTITAEINAYKRVAGEAIFEIGRRLKHVKENDLVHGQWERWCREEIEITPQHANKFIRIADRFGNRTSTFGLGVDMLSLLASEPDEFITRAHTVPSTGATKTVDEMTVRELREVKAALKEAEERARKAEADYELVRGTLNAMHESPPEIEYVIRPDEAVAERLRRYEDTYGDIDAEVTSYATNIQDITASVMAFSRAVRDFTKRYSYLTQYGANISGLDALTSAEYTEARAALLNLAEELPDMRGMSRQVIDIA